MKFVIDGVRYHVDKCGNGYPLVALHGFTGSGETWRPFCDEWKDHSTLIMLDIIGHGQSDSPTDLERYKIENVACDLIKILDKLEINQVDLLGYSMGGRLALTFAMLYPHRVRKLVLESATPGIEKPQHQEERRLKDEKLADFIKKEGVESFINFWESIPLFESLTKLPEDKKESLRMQRLKNNQKGLINCLLGMGTGSQPSWWADLHQLRCDVLLITGNQDKKFCNIAEKMTFHLKNVDWQVIEDCGHINHVEKSEIFGTIVSEFLSNTY
ncbi:MULTISPECIES: 2-succinyl-6-hydroxy-2,4-cyclohexadiene-1-carboxylate synthase [unclassified Bacillus (in: firmicutes)]|uniref:2-succinyl-6-hydroxy-2, 4-cyclohexadiene-1-carboxylate synthase n=1 Tax=unclassified Bacillus (in: firmicutes) TaxID=185979 RepID=UPI0008E3A0D4|nr:MULTISPECIES: 2-succinyl-6-hydroxy-2,4-cyclohexadiene-1-carboxylate synthase [unclassified Bacillus (in: firmicutes)]SFB18472.1 2-succinyl-6-hydroxy-2,4-cyclohexadiene-1-carboxylate synthase [Bacillus sp. UNCCL13]SFQ75963.1 2-succinyl-6-hydroxy-2,4-cyclohexadiene-1-carboxylate synthase [Bacillus sp. cl95]